MPQKVTPSSFNEIHTAFVTTAEGTSLSELLQVLGCISLTPLLVPLLLPWVVPTTFVKQAISNPVFLVVIRAILEYPVIAVLPVWIITVLAGDSAEYTTGGGLLLILVCMIVGILIANHAITAPKWLGIYHHWKKLENKPVGWNSVTSKTETASNDTSSSSGLTSLQEGKIPFVTSYRGIVIYITVLCILAVDFIIFPRRFAKTKDYGISLMDVGTGCFVFANGIVSPESRNKSSPLLKSLKSIVPIIILGLVRLVTVKGIEYQEVVEEYGVHWNFFFTLAGVKVFSSLFFKYFNSSHALKLAGIVAILYELFLQSNDFQNAFILNPEVPRTNSLLHANREGIFSVFGYLAIYMASVYFGKLIYWKERVTVRDWSQYALQTLLQVLTIWLLYGGILWCGILPCRRTANLGYILLMTSLNYSLLWGQMFFTLIQVCLQHHGIIYGPIIFYELAALGEQTTERAGNFQNKDKRLSKVAKNIKDETMVDEQMQELECRLKNAYEEIKSLKLKRNSSVSSRLVVKKIDAIEAEIEQLERKLLDSASEAENEEGKAPESNNENKNLVTMPNLSKSPVLLEAICYNGLAVFLFGNLLTGLVNCAIYTMYAPVYLSLCYLWCYVTVITAFSIVLYWYQIQLKFW